MSEGLKQCPFCGKYPQTVVDDETEEKFGVKCFNCGGAIYPEKDTLDEAIEAWNRRAGERIKDLPSSQPETHEKRTETHACDLISRQAAIDALIEWYGCEPTDIGAFENIIEKLPSAQPDMSEYSDKLWKAAYERGKAEAQQRWIPCSERLPEPRADVWTCSDIGQIQGYYEENVGIWYASFGQGRDYLELYVTAWMPLPEPYKGEQNGKD